MKTPHAILIGLLLIATAIFFKDTAVKPAHASNGKDTNMACHFGEIANGNEDRCWILQGEYRYAFNRMTITTSDPSSYFRWRR